MPGFTTSFLFPDINVWVALSSGGHVHHHECDENHSQPPSSDSNAGHNDHDSDAVYLPNHIGVSLANNSVASLDRLQVVSMLAIEAVRTPAAAFACLAEPYSPDECSPACPLYLALRALRI